MEGGSPEPEVDHGVCVDVVVEVYSEIAVDGAVAAVAAAAEGCRDRAVGSQQT